MIMAAMLAKRLVAVILVLLPSLLITITVSFYPLSPDMKMHILFTVLHIFVMEQGRRICLNIKTSYPL